MKELIVILAVLLAGCSTPTTDVVSVISAPALNEAPAYVGGFVEDSFSWYNKSMQAYELKHPEISTYLMFTSYTKPTEEMKEMAAKLRGRNVHDTINNIEQFVLYEKPLERYGVFKYNLTAWRFEWYADKALKQHYGVCDEQANIMTSMLRANGIYAREVSGYAPLIFNLTTQEFQSSTKFGTLHRWVEVLYPNKDGIEYIQINDLDSWRQMVVNR